jgi:hypothetical protein
MKILSEDEVGLVTSAIAFICGIWLLFDNYMIINHYSCHPFIKVFPVFSLVIFPFIAILIGIFSLVWDLSILGFLAIIINTIAIIVGKNALPIVYKIISKTF